MGVSGHPGLLQTRLGPSDKASVNFRDEPASLVDSFEFKGSLQTTLGDAEGGLHRGIQMGGLRLSPPPALTDR